MSRLRELCDAYHRKFHPDQPDMTPRTITPELLGFRRRLHDEEVEEVAEAWDNVEMGPGAYEPLGALAHLLHELADVVIVAYGTAARCGIDLSDVAEIVLAAGMEKIPNPDPAGKALKPLGFVPADERVYRLVAGIGGEGR